MIFVVRRVFVWFIMFCEIFLVFRVSFKFRLRMCEWVFGIKNERFYNILELRYF